MEELGKSLLKVVTAHRIFRASCLVLTGQPSAWGRAVQCKGKGRLTAALDETLRELGKSLLKVFMGIAFCAAFSHRPALCLGQSWLVGGSLFIYPTEGI